MNTPPTLPDINTVDLHHKILGHRYQILKRLGSGGMSEVWHAYDVKLRSEVALKAFRLQDENSIEALRREVRIAREVISPNVCRVFDLITEEEQELISMEYIDGVNLCTYRIQNGPLDLNEALDVATQFLAGLQSIHDAGLVHCDLKPENIMVGRSGRVVVMDFGVAMQAGKEHRGISGTLPYLSLEQLEGEPPTALSDIYAAGVILAELIFPSHIFTEETRETIWSLVRENTPAFPDHPWKTVITRAVAVNKTDRYGSPNQLSRALEEITIRTEADEKRKPYPGLASFQNSDADYFFGREQEVETLIRKLQQHYLMALIGPSGAGKTSLLQAGLMPVLPQHWTCVLMHPGDSPIQNLQASLDELLTPEKKTSYTEFVLIVDRFEELFTLNRVAVQSEFAQMLWSAATESNVRVLVSMRDDFLIFCKEHPPLAPIFSELTAMLPITGAALRRAMVQPALKCGYRFEDEALIDEILRDVEKERSALPLLAFAASLLWERRDRQSGMLKRQAYREIGGVQGALAQYAETVMVEIGGENDGIVRELFRNLTTAQNTRVARETDELLSVFPDPTLAEKVLRKLIDARLLTSYETSVAQDSGRRVEISHESLLTNWPRLVAWQGQDAEMAHFRDQLRQAAQLWEQRSRSRELVWRGSAYDEFQLWRKRYPGGLSKTEEAFAHVMQALANKTRVRNRAIAVTTFVILLAMTMFFGILWRRSSLARDEAVRSEQKAQAATVLTVGKGIDNADATTKLAYAIASLEKADTAEGRRFALQAISEAPIAFLNQIPFGKAANLDFSPDGRWVATGGVEGVRVFAFDHRSIFHLSDFRMNPLKRHEWPLFSEDGNHVIWVSGADRRVVKVWSQSSRKIVRSFQFEGKTVCIVRRGSALLVTDPARTETMGLGPGKIIVRLWNFDNQEPKVYAQFGSPSVIRPDISDDFNWFTYTDGPGIYVRSLDNNSQPTWVGNHGPPTQVIFRPGHPQVASGDGTGEVRLWSFDSTTKVPIRIIAPAEPVAFEDYDFWFDPTGKFLFIGDETAIRRYDLTAPEESQPLLFRNTNEQAGPLGFDRFGSRVAIRWMDTFALYPMKQSFAYTIRGPGRMSSFDILFAPDGRSYIYSFEGKGLHISSTPGTDKPFTRNLWKPPSGQILAIDVHPSGNSVIVGTNAASGDGPQIVSLLDGKSTPLKRCLPARIYDGVSFSPDGNLAAAVAVHGEPSLHEIELWDLKTGQCRVIEASRAKPSFTVKFAPDGTLYSGDSDGNVHAWNLVNGTSKKFPIGTGIVTGLAISSDGRFVAASALSAKKWDDVAQSSSALKVIDLKSDSKYPIESHGTRVFRVAFDQTGTRLITGDLDGDVRVGAVSGETPHLLLGHKSHVGDVTVSPDGKWIASIGLGEPEVRLWPMPTGQPLNGLPYEELLKQLKSFTNVRAIADKNTALGYRLEYTPSADWQFPNFN